MLQGSQSHKGHVVIEIHIGRCQRQRFIDAGAGIPQRFNQHALAQIGQVVEQHRNFRRQQVAGHIQ
ncbi:hypothetical protein ACQ86O_27835 (plasmid) [Serratia sp. L9]|uniref:hypothetical protein n=1 Tax=Serratia sp. L9 TaxID=3423946 RepID=UPI003D674C2F